MRLPIAFVIAAIWFASPALGQSQQAGNDASTNADETFKKLVEKCDNVDALVLRARIRLATGRLDDGSFDDLTNGMNQGLSLCGEGKIEEAMASLKETLAAADKRVSDKFGQEGDSARVKAAAAESGEKQKPESTAAKGDEPGKPWWKFW